MQDERLADSKGRRNIVREKHANVNVYKDLEQRQQWTEYPEIYIK